MWVTSSLYNLLNTAFTGKINQACILTHGKWPGMLIHQPEFMWQRFLRCKSPNIVVFRYMKTLACQRNKQAVIWLQSLSLSLSLAYLVQHFRVKHMQHLSLPQVKGASLIPSGQLTFKEAFQGKFQFRFASLVSSVLRTHLWLQADFNLKIPLLLLQEKPTLLIMWCVGITGNTLLRQTFQLLKLKKMISLSYQTLLIPRDFSEKVWK